LKKNNFYLSRVLFKDLKLTYDLANEITVRKWSLNSSRIKYESHKKWFKKKLKKKEFYFWKLMKNSICYGLIRIELIRKKYQLSYLIAKKFRGKNLGSKIIILAVQKIYKEKSNSTRIFAKSFIKNIFSNGTLLKSGFKLMRKIRYLNYYVYKK
jgi:RimJ/RimL family protein N-acetyltransferase